MTDGKELPRYRLLQPHHIGGELQPAGAEIIHEGKPGSAMKPLNAAAVRAAANGHADVPAFRRLDELRAERETLVGKLEAAHAERARLIADDPGSAELKRLRRETDELVAAIGETSAAIAMLEKRAAGEADEAAHQAALARHGQAVALAEKRAALGAELERALAGLAGVVVKMADLAAQAQRLAGHGLTLDERIDLNGRFRQSDNLVPDYVVAELVRRGALPQALVPFAHQNALSPYLEALVRDLRALRPEDPGAGRARAEAAAAMAAADREAYEAIQRRGKAAAAGKAVA